MDKTVSLIGQETYVFSSDERKYMFIHLRVSRCIVQRNQKQPYLTR